MDDLVKGNAINNEGITAKYLKEKKESLSNLSKELIDLIVDRLNKDETVNIFRDKWDEKYKKVKEDNVG